MDHSTHNTAIQAKSRQRLERREPTSRNSKPFRYERHKVIIWVRLFFVDRFCAYS